MRVVTTGMGQAAAARSAATELSGPVDAVVVAGVAGGCDPALATGTVVVATSLCDLEGAPLTAPAVTAAAREAALGAVTPAVPGIVASVDAVVDSASARARLLAVGAVAVETEAAAWAGICGRTAVPLLVVRAVLDTAARPLGAAASLVLPGADAPSAGRLLGLLAHPAAWPSLPRLARAAGLAESRAAAAAVAAARLLGAV